MKGAIFDLAFGVLRESCYSALHLDLWLIATVTKNQVALAQMIAPGPARGRVNFTSWVWITVQSRGPFLPGHGMEDEKA